MYVKVVLSGRELSGGPGSEGTVTGFLPHAGAVFSQDCMGVGRGDGGVLPSCGAQRTQVIKSKLTGSSHPGRCLQCRSRVILSES